MGMGVPSRSGSCHSQRWLCSRQPRRPGGPWPSFSWQQRALSRHGRWCAHLYVCPRTSRKHVREPSGGFGAGAHGGQWHACPCQPHLSSEKESLPTRLGSGRVVGGLVLRFGQAAVLGSEWGALGRCRENREKVQ